MFQFPTSHQLYNLLCIQAKKVFDNLAENYKLDESSLYLAHIVASAWDHMKQAEEILEAQGLIVSDRYGSKKVHPAQDILRSNRAQIMQALKQLALTPAADNDWVLRDFG